jgi:putative acetyltransferase
MAVLVRALRPDEVRTYLEVVHAAVHGLAGGPYSPEILDAWAPALTAAAVEAVAHNERGEHRFAAESAGQVIGIGALLVEEAELLACYVRPAAAGRGCGTALVRAIEATARSHGLHRLDVTASTNAEGFYARLGYLVRRRGVHTLANGVAMPAVFMTARLDAAVTSPRRPSRSS